MPVTKPTAYPEWAQTDVVDPTSGQNNVVAADAAHMALGWDFKEKPPRQYFNWLGRLQEQWARYNEAASCERIQGMRTYRLASSVFVGEGRARGIGGEQDAIVVTSPIEKSVGTWTLGTGNGGVAAGVFPWAPDSWIHFFVIKRDSDGVVDAGFDTNLDALALLADSGFDQYRRVASVYLVNDASDYIRAFNHVLSGDLFRWEDGVNPVRDYNGSVPALAPFTITLAMGVPPGFDVPVHIMAQASAITSAWELLFIDGYNGGAGAGAADARNRLWAPAGATDVGAFLVVTEATQKIFVEPYGTTTPPVGLIIDVAGYVDDRSVPLSTWY
jgi:hypothetical protein